MFQNVKHKEVVVVEVVILQFFFLSSLSLFIVILWLSAFFCVPYFSELSFSAPHRNICKCLYQLHRYFVWHILCTLVSFFFFYPSSQNCLVSSAFINHNTTFSTFFHSLYKTLFASWGWQEPGAELLKWWWQLQLKGNKKELNKTNWCLESYKWFLINAGPAELIYLEMFI